MTVFGVLGWVILSWALMAPGSFGRHLAEIVDAYEVKRTLLRRQRREPTP